MRFITNCFLILLAALMSGGAAFAASDPPTVQTEQSPDIEVFVREGCPHCAKAKRFLAVLQQEQPGLRIEIRDVSRDSVAMKRLKILAERHSENAVRVPAFAIGDQLIVGYSEAADTGQLIRDSLARSRPVTRGEAALSCGAEASPSCGVAAPKAETFSVAFLGRKVSLEQVGLPLFTVTLGLLDGFNPCSMWVLILMISLLAPLNNRPRMFAIAGTFVAVQGIAYFVFMAAWLNLFLLIGLSRASEIVIAGLALLAGALNLKDFVSFGRGISLSIPGAAKPGIYARMRRIMTADDLTAALLGTVVLGVLVQVVELMCTSGFPALFTRILTLERLDTLGYYAYLLLYDLAYMLDDMIVLVIGVVTLSQHRLQEREGRWLKLISGVVMVGLGVYLLLIPHWTS